MKITKKQITHIYDVAKEERLLGLKREIEQWYPELFKSSLEVGKWYKCKSVIFNYQEEDSVFGFLKSIGWHDKNWAWSKNGNEVEAREEDIVQALIREVDRRNIKTGDIISYPKEDFPQIMEGNKNTIYEMSFIYYKKEDSLYIDECLIYQAGKWAEIIDKSTLFSIEEAERFFNIKIIEK